MRPIDADALKFYVNSISTHGLNDWSTLGVLAAVDKQPTIDAVPVVRCKDCIHNVANWQHEELDITDYTDITCDYYMTDGQHPNDYCSRGKKEG